jgi:hypothetical protein
MATGITNAAYRLECTICGCSGEKDVYGDRICFCDTCEVNGGCYMVIYQLPKNNIIECVTCGCSAEHDKYGDRLCYCDTCKISGCKIQQQQEDKEQKEEQQCLDEQCTCSTCVYTIE